MSHLTIKRNGTEIKQVPLGSTMKIGRRSSADLQLEDTQLSREHAEITAQDGRFFLKDLGSTNGTMLDGQRIEPNRPVELKHGMKAEFASYLVEFTIVPAKPGKPAEELEDSKWSAAPPGAKPLLEDLIRIHGKIPVWTKGELALEVADILEETPDVKTFRLVGKEPVLFSYKPGQFVTIKAPIGGKTVRRSYSMSSSPSRPHTIEVTVKRVPGGLVSNWMCDELKLGSELCVTGPAGKFSCFDYPSRKLFLVGAGSGVTPLMSMARWIVDTSADVDVVMLVSAKNPADIIFRKELELMSARHSGFRLFFTMTRSWHGIDAWAGLNGHCKKDMLALVAQDLADRHVFLCGPNPFMDCVKEGLRALDFPLERLHTESFDGARRAQGDPPEAALAAAPAAAAPPRDVGGPRAVTPLRPAPQSVAPLAPPVPVPAQARTGRQIDFVGKGQIEADGDTPLLVLAERRSIAIDYQCRVGSCGRCRVLCKSGTVEHKAECDQDELALDASERAEGYVLACVGVPRSDCAIVVEG